MGSRRANIQYQKDVLYSPPCCAARPTPSDSYIVSNMSSTRLPHIIGHIADRVSLFFAALDNQIFLFSSKAKVLGDGGLGVRDW